MPSGHAYAKAFRTCKTCVGTDFCRYGLGDSTALGIRIEKRYQGLESPGKVKMATAGCPRNCSEAYVKDVGLVAIGDDRWEIYIGGAAGAHIRKGDLLATAIGHDESLKLIDRFLMYYIENARYLERTYGFVERLGIEKLKTIRCRRRRRDRRAPRRRDAGSARRLLRSMAGSGEESHAQSVPHRTSGGERRERASL